MTVSATTLPEQKRAIVGAGKRGLASVPSGAEIVIGRNSPEFVGTGSWVAESSRMERSVSRIAMSTVPSNGMLIGRSTCGDGARSGRRGGREPSTVTATAIGRSR